jgi:glucose/arabinose dehydrogenase
MRRTLRHSVRAGLAATLALGAAGCATMDPELEQGSLVPHSTEGLQASAEFPVVRLPPGYRIEKVVGGLTYPTSVTWDDQGRMYVAEAGGAFLEEGPPARILRIDNGRAIEVANLNQVMGYDSLAAVTGLVWHNGALYFTHRAKDRTGAVSRMSMDGRVTQLFSGFVDSATDHQLNDIRVGPDGRMYFTSGAGGNAGVLGQDMMPFVLKSPWTQTTACKDLVLLGKNFHILDYRTEKKGDIALTGAFSPLGTPTQPGHRVPGRTKCGGAILSFDANNPEATIRPYAWGFRNVIGLAWGANGQMDATQNGYDVAPPRPVNDTADPTYFVREGAWYGVPDFSAAFEPLTDPRFEAPGQLYAPVSINGQKVKEKLGFVIDHQASGLTPPDKSLILGLHPHNSSPSKPDVAPASWGEWAGHVFVAEWGDLAPSTNVLREQPVGVRIVRIDPETEEIHEFAANPRPGTASNQGAKGRGLERPFDVAFGPDGAMYIADFGLVEVTPGGYIWTPETGRIWKVTRTGNQPPQQSMQTSRQQIQRERIPVRKDVP